MSDWQRTADPEATAEAEVVAEGRARARSGSGGSHKGVAKGVESVGADGTAKRNIVRKGRDPMREKRQGGGHKGHWAATDDGTLMVTKGSLDKDDPNYDSADDDPENIVLVADEEEARYDGGRRVREEDIVMSLTAFKARIADSLKEYFVSEDMEEMVRSVSELNAKFYHYELVKRAISMSLDGKERERELVSRLLSTLYPSLLSTADVGKGFERLFETVDDLRVDVPSAVRDIATFLARAVVDELLPPSFLSDPLVVGLGGEMVEHAKLLLSRDHMGARLEHIWGPGDGRSVPDMKVAIDQLVQEYLLSRQLEEAARCVRELACPLFHHEVVKRAVVLALDKKEEGEHQAISSLLAFLFADEVISGHQMRKGFTRLYQLLPDLALDAPNAAVYLAGMVVRAKADGCLPSDFSPQELSQLASNGKTSSSSK